MLALNLRYRAQGLGTQVKHHAVHQSPAGQHGPPARATIKGPSSAWSIWREGKGGEGRDIIIIITRTFL
jgi:hypothetical protein